MAEPTGLSERQVIMALAQIRAFGEVMKLPPADLEPILARAARELRERP